MIAFLKLFFLGVFVVPLLSAISLVFLLMLREGDLYVVGLFPIFYVFSILATLVFGLPVFCVIYSRRVVGFRSMLVAGFLIGSIVSVVVRLPGAAQWDELVVFSCVGMVSSYCFFLMWRKVVG